MSDRHLTFEEARQLLADEIAASRLERRTLRETDSPKEGLLRGRELRAYAFALKLVHQIERTVKRSTELPNLVGKPEFDRAVDGILFEACVSTFGSRAVAGFDTEWPYVLRHMLKGRGLKIVPIGGDDA